jgi:AcrR family transcriptional regulator
LEASPRAKPELTRLPSGRHRLTRDDVVASQRGRLIEAMVEAVAEKGYGPVTVADVVEGASVSRRTFYEQFAGKEECFLAAYDAGVQYALGRLAEAAEGIETDDWRARTESDIAAYLRVLSDEPAFAWALHVEVLGVGPAALERRAQIFAMFADRTRRAHELARAADDRLPELPDEAFLLHTGGMDELIRECLRTRGAAALPDLIAPAITATLALFGAAA